jgi:hypothetical protein
MNIISFELLKGYKNDLNQHNASLMVTKVTFKANNNFEAVEAFELALANKDTISGVLEICQLHDMVDYN